MKALAKLGGVLGRLVHGAETAEMVVTPAGPAGSLLVPGEGDGRHEVREVQGRPCLTPDASSYYLYAVLPAELLTDDLVHRYMAV